MTRDEREMAAVRKLHNEVFPGVRFDMHAWNEAGRQWYRRPFLSGVKRDKKQSSV